MCRWQSLFPRPKVHKVEILNPSLESKELKLGKSKVINQKVIKDDKSRDGNRMAFCSQDKMSFGQFMDSFEQQKEEIVKEWLKRNDVDVQESTWYFDRRNLDENKILKYVKLL